MNITPDYLIERRRSKWGMTKWKVFALILIAIICFMWIKRDLQTDNLTNVSLSTSDHIASVRIADVIVDNPARSKKLAKLEKDEKVKAVIVHINSPGGSVVGSEMLYNSLRKISEKKPVVVVMESLAASGGYLAALGGDYIIAHNGTITGSIGVIMQSGEVTELAEKLGIKFNNFKSGEFKAAPNYTEKLTDEARQVTMESINQVYDYFIGLVAERRKLDLDYVRTIADGRVYSGQQAFKLKLIDEVGNDDSALKWLHEKKDIAETLEVVDFKLKSKDKFIDLLLEDLQTRISSVFSSSFKGMKSII